MWIRRLFTAIMLGSIISVFFITGTARPVLALSIDDYFTYTYSFAFSKTSIVGSETIIVTASGQAVCVQNLPLTVSAASVVSKVVARHKQTGTEIVLNPSYSIRYDSGFPSQKGQSASASVQVALSFPDGSPAGEYDIIGQILEAKVSVLVITIDVAGYLPSTQAMGTVTYSPLFPASFVLSNLALTPDVVTKGKTVEITALLSNNGDTSGTYEVIMKVDGQIANSQSIELAGKSSQVVKFTHLASIEGQHIVVIGSLSQEFSVKPLNWLLFAVFGGLGLGLGIGCSIIFVSRRKKSVQ